MLRAVIRVTFSEHIAFALDSTASKSSPSPLDISRSTQPKANLVTGTPLSNLPWRASVRHADDAFFLTLEVIASSPMLEVVASSPVLEVIASSPMLEVVASSPTLEVVAPSPAVAAAESHGRLFLTSSDSEAPTPMWRASPLVSLMLRILAAVMESGAGSVGQTTEAPPSWRRARSCAGMWLLTASTSSSPSVQRLRTSSSSTRHDRRTSCFP
jgi:hypothetical protein